MTIHSLHPHVSLAVEFGTAFRAEQHIIIHDCSAAWAYLPDGLFEGRLGGIVAGQCHSANRAEFVFFSNKLFAVRTLYYRSIWGRHRMRTVWANPLPFFNQTPALAAHFKIVQVQLRQL